MTGTAMGVSTKAGFAGLPLTVVDGIQILEL